MASLKKTSKIHAQNITVAQLARFMFEELERDYGGDINPDLFAIVADGTANDQEDEETMLAATGLEEVLGRVIARMEAGKVVVG